MITKLTAENLRLFEELVANKYNGGIIKAPVHLSGGNEEQLIKIFEEIKEDDWVCSTWRSHYHCLLKGVPPEQLMKDICDGHSITLNYPEQRVITSAIVGGILKIATGLAYGIKELGGKETVWCFVGDMTAAAGDFYECWKYACHTNLLIEFVVEDNGKSVGTDTRKVWGLAPDDGKSTRAAAWGIRSYSYKLPWPHSGAGKWVEF